jgi:predicted TIM-barrel fold metal-dependent hydrolase
MQSRQPIADCDVHEGLRSFGELRPYLPAEWRMYLNRDSLGRLPAKHVYANPSNGTSLELVHADGTSDDWYPDRMREQLLDRFGITVAMLVGVVPAALTAMPQSKFAAAAASAYNDWLIDVWLSADPRFRGSVGVAAQEPLLAAREIDRVGGHPSMVQVNLPASPPLVPWGHEMFHPIWEAAVRNDLRVSFHVGTPTGIMGTPVASGWPATYMELRSGFPHHFQAGLLSMVCAGVFERFPDLRIVHLEGGFSWVPGLMWRLDQSWRDVRREVPWLKRRPSDTIREHVRFGTQPMEEPDDPRHLLQLIDMMGSEDLLMFSTDYPHWDFDAPQAAIPAAVGPALRRKILWENARDFYGLPEPAGQPAAALPG